MDQSILLYLLILAVPLMAQFYVKFMYNKSRQVKNTKQISGFEVAREILDKNGLNDMYVVETQGIMSDHYDSRQKVIRLSKEVYHGESIASMSIAAHEVGHALQDKDGYLFMRIRSFIFPIVNIGTKLSYFVLFIGVAMQMADLVNLGIVLVSLGLLFQLVTLPVEFDASKRALKELVENNIASNNDKDKSKKMLTAAALTYVAGVLASLMEILRLMLIFQDEQ